MPLLTVTGAGATDASVDPRPPLTDHVTEQGHHS